jgi:hypothetical protein
MVNMNSKLVKVLNITNALYSEKMKNKLIKYILSFSLVVFLFATSCEKWVDPDLNIDPDNAMDVYSALILPAAEGNLAYVIQGFDYVGVTGMWLQYFEGFDRQAQGMYNYNLTADDCDNFYGALYSGIMTDCQKIIERTSVSGKESPHLRGMAKVMKAVAQGTAVGLWGDIPASSALLGDENLKPTFDSEESVYSLIQNLLTEAIADLSVAGKDFEDTYMSTAAQDLIYGGNLNAWKRAAYSLKARYELRLSRKAGKFSADNILSNLALGISDNSQDFQFNFAGNAAYVDDNPLWIFTEDRYGYAGNNANFLDLLTANDDPRMSVYDDGDLYIGGPALGYPSSPALIISNFEALFIKAECLWIKNDKAGAADAFNEAVTASLEKWDVADNAWLGANASETDATITLDKIMTAKYIAMYAQGEAWSDYRRHQFAYPVLTPPVDNQTNGVQPSSFPYPTNEKVTNGANVPQRGGITAKLWAFN